MFNGHSVERMIACKNLEDLSKVAREIIEEGEEYPVWLFEGSMGAGKTTLIKAICKEFDVIDNVSSPSFSLVNEYQSTAGKTFYHFDFYRIRNELEAMDIGVDEYFYSGEVCFVEWPSKIPNLIPESFMKIKIEVNRDNSRSISLIKNGKSV